MVRKDVTGSDIEENNLQGDANAYEPEPAVDEVILKDKNKLVVLDYGGGVAESFLYPIYGGLILLAGLVVGCTVLILEEIRSLKDKIDGLSDK